ncbi:MAG: hypothetical protein Sylvanvirus28_9 [Sylvanvirus sp.]|uniref:Uncharacterized protein n=1 Tax=Sylvanvirus sp. TaxID=2487774 RepID=A0A3G5AIW7_9VIRU|nr:MAG: hypothetical protein Sylvanvirus28_9 [Sylvanvirus sp.]
MSSSNYEAIPLTTGSTPCADSASTVSFAFKIQGNVPHTYKEVGVSNRKCLENFLCYPAFPLQPISGGNELRPHHAPGKSDWEQGVYDQNVTFTCYRGAAKDYLMPVISSKHDFNKAIQKCNSRLILYENIVQKTWFGTQKSNIKVHELELNL